MIQCQLKLRPCKAQVEQMERWLYHLQSVWNWAVRKVELDAKDHIYHSSFAIQNMLAGHGQRIGVPSHVLREVAISAHRSWARCFKDIARRPRLKGHRNRLNSFPIPDPIKSPSGTRISVLGIRSIRFHGMTIPNGRITSGRIIKRASGWYLCLFIDAEPLPIERTGFGAIGIDPGFKNLLTTSAGELIEHPRELTAGANRLAQAQRGKSRKLVARLCERITNRRKDRNHKLSRRLVSENTLIAWSADRHSAIARKFGKSVSDSGHYQLRMMLAYKSRLGGTQFIEVSSRYSTMTCSACGALSGPTGLSGLAVRQWGCACGAIHDRDVNAAKNTLIAGLGMSLGVQKPEKSGVHEGIDERAQPPEGDSKDE